jgi:hypothetical protein
MDEILDARSWGGRTCVQPCHMQPPSSPDLRAALARGLKAMYAGETQLLNVDVGERTLVGHLARYLAPEVLTWGSEWAVDTEYNRMSSRDHEDAIYKYLLDVLDDPRRPAYPDLIVHQRGVDGSDGGNLLVVEAKKSPGKFERREDHAKVVSAATGTTAPRALPSGQTRADA